MSDEIIKNTQQEEKPIIKEHAGETGVIYQYVQGDATKGTHDTVIRFTGFTTVQGE